MLFLLTGDIQIGKTRWLMGQVDALEAQGVRVGGVVAPGVWIDRKDAAGSDGRYEKVGIDNLLLPKRELVPFARRRDLAEQAGTFDPASQASRADLGWAIEDHAIDRVNAHFEQMGAHGAPGYDLVVADEFGRLELERKGGLVQAVALIEQGAHATARHALIVVRAALLEAARTRFADAPWGGMRVIHPDARAAADLARTVSRLDENAL